MLKKVLIFLLVVVALLVVGGFVMPKDYEVSRSVVIDAKPERVHQMLGDLRRWPEWAPWHEEDPTIETTFGQVTTGVGASQSWTGKDGEGRLQLTASDPVTGIAYDMAFIDGETEMPAKSAMRYEVVDGKTQVTWTMNGEMNVPVLGPYLALIMPSSIGGMFDKGLQNLKAEVEKKG